MTVVSKVPTKPSGMLLYRLGKRKSIDAFIQDSTRPGVAAAERQPRRLCGNKRRAIERRWRRPVVGLEELGSLDDVSSCERTTPTTRMTAHVPVDSSPVPSIVQASTKEEDYFFTSLGLDDDEVDQDASVGSGPTAKGDDLPKSRNRDERMRAAYEESKRLYKAEHGYTETGVSSAIAMGFASFPSLC